MARSLPVPLLPRWTRWLAVVAVAAFLFYVSIVTVPPEQVAPKPDLVPLDKWRHFIGYGVFGFTLAYAVVDSRHPTRVRAAIVVGVALLYGVGIEVGQSFLPQRYFSVGDGIANAIGAGLSLTWFLVEPRLRFVPLDRLGQSSE